MLSIVLAATVAFQSSSPILGCRPDSGRTLPVPSMTEPTVVVGGEADSPLFPVASAVLAENLALAVSNAGTNEILLFEPDGSFKKRLGGTGEGPSEFRMLGRMQWMDGDRLAATGEGLRKVVVMDFQGDFVTSHSFRELNAQGVFPLPRGQWLVHSISSPSPKPGGGRLEVEGTLTVHDSDGRMQMRLATIRSFELIDLESPGGGVARGLPPFTKATIVGVDHTGCVWLANDDDASVEVYDLTGRPRGMVSLRDHVPLEVTQDEWDEAIERMVQREPNPSARGPLRRMLEGIPFDPGRPAFSGMKVDDAGHVWLTPYHNADEDVPGWWVVAGLAVEPT